GRAASVADFYRGKVITLIVGYGPGGGFDVIGRLVARHLSQHMPGAPAVVVQNMTGAGSLVAANYIYNVAPKDGTQIGLFARNMALLGLLGGNPNVPLLLRDALGLRMKLILGYRDSAAIFLAMERGELAGRMVELSSIRATHPQWLLRDSEYRLLLMYARTRRDPE